MAKYAGLVGYAISTETAPSVWKDVITPRKMRGDVLRNTAIVEQGATITDDIAMQQRISLIGNPFAYENYLNIKWVDYMKVKWKISSIELAHPRIIVTLGGVYNGK